MKVTIDGSAFNTMEELHELLKLNLNLHDDYEGSLDELWNSLMNECEMPLTIYWIDFEESKLLLGDDLNEIIDLFNEAHDEIEDFVIEYE